MGRVADGSPTRGVMELMEAPCALLFGMTAQRVRVQEQAVLPIVVSATVLVGCVCVIGAEMLRTRLTST